MINVSTNCILTLLYILFYIKNANNTNIIISCWANLMTIDTHADSKCDNVKPKHVLKHESN